MLADEAPVAIFLDVVYIVGKGLAEGKTLYGLLYPFSGILKDYLDLCFQAAFDRVSCFIGFTDGECQQILSFGGSFHRYGLGMACAQSFYFFLYAFVGYFYQELFKNLVAFNTLWVKCRGETDIEAEHVVLGFVGIQVEVLLFGIAYGLSQDGEVFLYDVIAKGVLYQVVDHFGQ